MHLFQTSRPPPGAGHDPRRPSGLRRLHPGVRRRDRGAGRALLHRRPPVAGRRGGYMTMDGTVADERMWTVSEVIVSGDRRILRLGHPLE
ncbi:hypothetical protein ACFSTC_31235 [Nonomuraea ferruginea]